MCSGLNPRNTFLALYIFGEIFNTLTLKCVYFVDNAFHLTIVLWMLFVHMYHAYYSKDRKIFLGRASKMGNILNVKNQGHFQIMLDKIKGNKEKRKAIITFERAPYVLLLLPPWNLLHMSFTQGSSSQKKIKSEKKPQQMTKYPTKKPKKQPKIYWTIC